MGPIQIIFIALTAAIPGWMYFKSKPSETNARLHWGNWEENMEKILDGSGGFTHCSNSDVIRYLRELCEKSMDEWEKHKEEDSIVIERASNSIVFSCEVTNDVTFVQWKLEQSDDGDIKCQPGKRGEILTAEPAFVFNKNGNLISIEFWSRDGERQSVNTANCRRKIQLTMKRNAKPTTMDAVDRMPRLKSDPPDYVTANRICFEYDVSTAWAEARGEVR